jgi:hypothetical protein
MTAGINLLSGSVRKRRLQTHATGGQHDVRGRINLTIFLVRLFFMAMATRQMSITEFKSHCTEEIRAMEKGGVVLELTRHGKTVAFVSPPSTGKAGATLGDWVGSGKGTVRFGSGYDAAAPACDPENWES